MRFAACLLLAITAGAQFIPFPGPGRAAAGGGGGGGTTYFGGVSDTAGNPLVTGASTDTIDGFTAGIDPAATANVTCPGTGSKTLVSLGIYSSVNGGTGTVRLAIYGPIDGTHDHNLVAQGSSAIVISNTTLAWAEHTTFTNASGTTLNPVTLTGGSKYQIVATAAPGNLTYYGIGTAGTNNVYDGTDRTAGFPATLTLATSGGSEMGDFRAGVQ